MRPFAYASPATVDEAIALLGRDGPDEDGGRPLAGGTDLLTLMKADITAPTRLVDIKRLVGLPGAIEITPEGLTLGALATLAELETDPLVRQHCPALAEAASAAATPPLRNMATLGGNLLQRPRCWYFRNPRFHCWLKGGDVCQARDGESQLHALFGDSPCVAVHPSDLATALVALDARVSLRGPGGERTLPLGDFFALPDDDRRTENTLGGDELVLAVTIPAANGTRSTYLKAMDRRAWSFALVGVVAAARVVDGRIAGARLVLGGVAPTPWRARAAEQVLIGAEASEALFARAATVALEGAAPLRDNAYKVPLAETLVRRALAAVTRA